MGKGQWERVLEMVRKIRSLDMEVCTTLGMLTPEQAMQLREAGLTAYNHNLDTSPEFYPKVSTTRTYEVRALAFFVNVNQKQSDPLADCCIWMTIGFDLGFHQLNEAARTAVSPPPPPHFSLSRARLQELGQMWWLWCSRCASVTKRARNGWDHRIG